MTASELISLVLLFSVSNVPYARSVMQGIGFGLRLTSTISPLVCACLILYGASAAKIYHSEQLTKAFRVVVSSLTLCLCMYVFTPVHVQVYYIPWVQFFKGSSFPTLFSMLPILRDIWIREGISIVHGHGVRSSVM